MATKLSVTQKKMAALGIMKTKSGDYAYIDPSEKNRYKYKPIKKESK